MASVPRLPDLQGFWNLSALRSARVPDGSPRGAVRGLPPRHRSRALSIDRGPEEIRQRVARRDRGLVRDGRTNAHEVTVPLRVVDAPDRGPELVLARPRSGER